jgi:type IV pilus assembly protein PilC
MSALDGTRERATRLWASVTSGRGTASGWDTRSAAAAPSAEQQRFGRLKQADIAWVCEQLAVTQDSGIPLYRALGLLAGMRPGTGLSRRLSYIQSQLSEGVSLGAAFAAQEKDWGAVVVALVSAGEASGSIAQAFSRAADLVHARLRLRRRLRSAMTYPSVVLAVTTILVATLLLVVVPRFEEIYDSLGAELPSMTLLVISIADKAPFLVAAAAVLAVGGFLLLRASRGNRALRMRIDRAKGRIPVLGPLLAKGVQSRVASTMGILLSAGVPLLEVLKFAAATAGSVPIEDALAQVRQDVADGATFSVALTRTGEFPELMVQLVAVGEESGSLAVMMEKYAARTAEEVDQATSTLTSLIEPLMMVVVGVVVGVFLLALYLPIISLSSNVR